MLRRLKMELKKQEALQVQAAGNTENSSPVEMIQPEKLVTKSSTVEKQRRVRGRRSSKPLMEKRRRARINQCLDILKNYVLSDEGNLSQFGVDTNSSENHNEEAIVRTILKSSGLINRHRGRKNPSNLEKADILELTVDYVRCLHQQRDQWIQLHQRYLSTGNVQESPPTNHQVPINHPLLLEVPSSHKSISVVSQAVPPSPPSSTTSISPQPLLSIVNYNRIATVNNTQHSASDILDLSHTGSRSRQNNYPQDNKTFVHQSASDACWRPWHQKLNVFHQ